MKLKLIALIGTLASAGILGSSYFSATQAASVSYSQTTITQANPITFTLNSFDPALGILTDIEISTTVSSVLGIINIFNPTGVTQTFTTGTVLIPFTITAPSISFVSNAISTTSGSVDSLSFKSFSLPTVSNTETANVATADFNLYKAGPVSFSISAGSPTFSVNNSQLLFNGSTDLDSAVKITYVYSALNSLATPEPSTNLGLVTVLVLGARLKSKLASRKKLKPLESLQ